MKRIDIDALEALLANDRVWPAPWTHSTWTVDCPAPGGEHCGDDHYVETIVAPDAYPCEQVVAQISVPGLDSLSEPNAALIAGLRNAAPDLIAEIKAGRALAKAAKRLLRSVHFDIVDEYEELDIALEAMPR